MHIEPTRAAEASVVVKQQSRDFGQGGGVDVTVARALNAQQNEMLEAVLKAATGEDVNVNTTVNNDLSGGIVIRMGSKLVDTSVATKLSNLEIKLNNAMKEVG